MLALIMTAAVSFPAFADEKKAEIPSCFGYTVKNGVCTITGYYGSDTKVTIPEGVEAIGACAFEDEYSIAEVVLPSSLKRIERRAFTSCGKLKKINFPDGLEYIGEDAFWGAGVEKIWLPDSVKFVGDHAFAGSQCVEARLPEGLTKLEWGTFLNCYALEKAELPSTLRSLGYFAFSGCYSLELVIPEGVTFIDQGALMHVKSIHFPMSVKEYADYFIGESDSPKISTPKYNKMLILALYGYDGTKHNDIKIEYTDDTVSDRFIELAKEKEYERPVVIDLDFCGDPELISFDKNGFGKIFYMSYDRLDRANITGVKNDRIFFGETDRKLWHLKDKNGRQLILFTVFRNDKNFPAKSYILEPILIYKDPKYYRYQQPQLTFRCTEIGWQKPVSLDEQNGRIKFSAYQAIGKYYSFESGECSREDLFPTLRSLMNDLTEQYVKDFEVIGEYDLDSFAENDLVFLGTFSDEPISYEPIISGPVRIDNRSFDIETNTVKLRLGADRKIDFDSLAKLENLSVLEISAENIVSLKGIEKLKNLRLLILRSGKNGGFTDTELVKCTVRTE